VPQWRQSDISVAAGWEFFLRLGSGKWQRAVKAECEDDGGDERESAFHAVERGGSDAALEMADLILRKPEQRDGAEAEGERELGATHRGTGEQRCAEEKIERSAGKERCEKSHRRAAGDGRKFREAETKTCGETEQRWRTRKFLLKTEAEDDEDGDEDPWKKNCG